MRRRSASHEMGVFSGTSWSQRREEQYHLNSLSIFLKQIHPSQNQTNSPSPWTAHFNLSLLTIEMSSPQQQWDTQSNLLLIQLIYKYGDPYTQSTTSSTQKDTTFEKIAHQLTQHTLIRPSKRKFTANGCEQHYIDLLAQEGLTRELSLPTSAAANKKRKPPPKIHPAPV